MTASAAPTPAILLAATMAQEGWAPFSDHAYLAFVGGFYWRKQGEEFQLGLQVANQHMNSNGVVHGGLLATMLDHTIGHNCVLAMAPLPLTTANLNVSFLRPVLNGDFVSSTGTVRKSGRIAAYGEGHLWVKGRPVTSAQGLFLSTQR